MRIKEKDSKTVYCSGALFCPEEVEAMGRIARVLEKAGYRAFLPHRDGVEAYALNAVNSTLANLAVFKPLTRLISRATFAVDINRILSCDCFVFNMNGRVPDEGGVVETGFAFAAGKPVVIYKDDPRSIIGVGENPVILGATGNFETVNDISDIPGAVEKVSARLEALGGCGYDHGNRPGFVERVSVAGGRVWRVLRRAGFLKPKNVMSSRISTIPVECDERVKEEK